MIILQRVKDGKGIKEVEFFIEIPKYTESVEPGVLDIQNNKKHDVYVLRKRTEED